MQLDCSSSVLSLVGDAPFRCAVAATMSPSRKFSVHSGTGNRLRGIRLREVEQV
jgi:hypothetical protein